MTVKTMLLAALLVIGGAPAHAQSATATATGGVQSCASASGTTMPGNEALELWICATDMLVAESSGTAVRTLDARACVKVGGRLGCGDVPPDALTIDPWLGRASASFSFMSGPNLYAATFSMTAHTDCPLPPFVCAPTLKPDAIAGATIPDPRIPGTFAAARIESKVDAHLDRSISITVPGQTVTAHDGGTGYFSRMYFTSADAAASPR